MDKLEDDRLREIFSKLKHYESDKPGTTWESLRSQLNSFKILKAVASVMLLVIFCISFYYVEHTEVTPLENKIETPSREVNPILGNNDVEGEQVQKYNTSTTLISRNANSNKGPGKKNYIAPTSDEQKPNIEAKFHVNNEATEEIDEPEIVVERITDEQDDGLLSFEVESQNEITIEKSEDDDIQKGERPVSISLSSFYAFGIVQPLSADNIVLRSYRPKPGYGIKLNVTVPIITRSTYSITMGPTYQLFQKKFYFETNNMQSENIIQTLTNETLTSHLAGLIIEYQIPQKKLNLGISITKSLRKVKSLSNYIGSTTLFFHGNKDIPLNKNNLFLQLGLAGGVPLTGSISTFKYYPFQLSMGLKNVFGKNQSSP